MKKLALMVSLFLLLGSLGLACNSSSTPTSASTTATPGTGGY